MIQKGLVSVVVPNYNYAHFLPACIESVLAQTYKNWELIVVDDNSTDRSREVVEDYITKYPHLNIQLFHNSKGPSGATTPINIGIISMKGEYFSWLSSDDVCKPEKLQTLVQALEARPEVGMVHSGFDFIDEKGKVIGSSYEDLINLNTLTELDFFLLFLDRNLINGNTVLVRRSLFDKVDLFEQGWETCHEVWIVAEVFKWIEICLESKIYSINKSLHQFRRHEATSLVNNSEMLPALCGLMIEEMLGRYSLEDFYEKLRKKGAVSVEYVETKIAQILIKYGRENFRIKRFEMIRENYPRVYSRLLENLRGIDQLELVAKLAQYYTLKESQIEKILAYEIEEACLKYLHAGQLYCIASALKKAGDLERAKMLFEEFFQARHLRSSHLEGGAYFHLGEIYLKSENLPRANELFSKCLSIIPDHRKCKEYLALVNERETANV